MSYANKTVSTIHMVEGTTKNIIISVLTEDGNADDLTGYQSSFCMKPECGADEVIKSCEINKNEISISLAAKDTLGLVGSNKYEIRVYKSGTVYSVISGIIKVDEAVHPYISMPSV